MLNTSPPLAPHAERVCVAGWLICPGCQTEACDALYFAPERSVDFFTNFVSMVV